MLSLFVSFVIIVAVVVSIGDVIGFYVIMEDSKWLTTPLVILMIIAMIIPIVINLWYCLVFKQG